LWLSLSHYIQYQSVKRDHATMLSFARAFTNMLERRRKRVTYAYYDDTGSDLCPPGGFPVEYVKTDRPMMSPRSAAVSSGDGENGERSLYSRGKLSVFDSGIKFMPAAGIEGVHDEATDVSDILAVKQEMGQPPRLVLTLNSDKFITIASQSARSIKKSLDKVMGAFAESGGGSNQGSSRSQERMPQLLPSLVCVR
jgi:hypothetical protein